MEKQTEMKTRCEWAGTDPLNVQYHDTEWGTPVFDDRKLFEFLILEGAQAGLSWITILKKRQNFAKAYDNFDAIRMARYNTKKIERLLENKGIIRNELKIRGAIQNAESFLQVQKELGGFATYIWQFVGGTPRKNAWESPAEIPSKTEESTAMSRDLKRRGFRFVGPTICYALMQAVGMVNDHTIDCFRYHEL